MGDDAAELHGGARKQDRFWIPKFGQLRGDGTGMRADEGVRV